MTDAKTEPEPTSTQSSDATALKLPKQTTPTWEMELLISGATVFAMLQLPALLDQWLYEYMPRFGRELSVVLLLTYVYTKAAVIALVFTFVLHLALRGYWVALVGMHSVHPEGIRWEKLKMGPFYGEMVKRRYASMPELIERAGGAVHALAPGARIYCFGHVGDGNLHYNVGDKALLARRAEVNEAVYREVAALGGSISAEHGLGQLKREEITRHKDALELELMRAVKRALDPLGLMNPGKVL